MSDVWVAVGAGGVALLAIVGLTAWLAWRRADAEKRALARRIMALPLRDKLRLGLRLARDRRIPIFVRAIPPALALYLATPIDVIPDFIPIIGHLDDILVVAVGVGLLLRFTPRSVVEEQLARLEAAEPTR